jgi:hypothetical protein
MTVIKKTRADDAALRQLMKAMAHERRALAIDACRFCSRGKVM